MEGVFEDVNGTLHAALRQTQGASVHTWYELVVGGESPSYMLMVPRRGWADYDAAPQTLGAVLERVYGSEAQALRQSLAAAVDHARSELWSYRQDLSYFPPRP